VGPVPKYCGPIYQIYLTKIIKNERSFKRSNHRMSVHVSKSTKYEHRDFFLVSVTLSVSLTHTVLLSPAIPTIQRNRPGGRRRLAREEDGPRRHASTPSTTSSRRAGGGQRAGRAGAAMEPVGRPPTLGKGGEGARGHASAQSTIRGWRAGGDRSEGI
jgi:hypothetical protein